MFCAGNDGRVGVGPRPFSRTWTHNVGPRSEFKNIYSISTNKAVREQNLKTEQKQKDLIIYCALMLYSASLTIALKVVQKQWGRLIYKC